MAKRRREISFFSHGTLFGSCLAMIISYTRWHHIGWAILHGILSWFYVIYYVVRYVIF